MKFVDRKTGKLVDVPDSQAENAFKSGQYGIPKDATFAVNSGGTVGTVDPTQAQSALDSNSTVPTEAQYREAQAANSSALGAAGAGIARGLGSTFLLPTDAMAVDLGSLMGTARHVNDPYQGEYLQSSGEQTREQLKQWQEAHPNASLAGELGGMAAGAILTGGGTLGGAGALAERAIPTLESRAAQMVARGMTRGAVEGALLGGTGAANEAALGDSQLNASKVFAGIGHGALFGAAAGGAFSGLGLVGEEARDAAGRYLRNASAKDIEAIAEKHFGTAADGLGEKLQKAIAKVSSATSGKDADLIEKFGGLTPEAAEARRIAVFDGEKHHAEAAIKFRQDGDALLRATTPLTDEARGALKKGHIEKTVMKGNEAEVHALAADKADAIIEGVRKEYGDALAPTMVKSVDTATKEAYLLKELLKGGADNADVFMHMDRLKRSIQKLTNNGYRSLPHIADPVDQINARRTVEFLDTTAQDLRASLEDSKVWGEAGNQQRAVNEAWSKQIEASKRFNRHFVTEGARDPSNPYLQERVMDPTRGESYLKELVNPNKDLKHQAVKDYLDSTEQLAKAMKGAYELPAEKLGAVSKIEKAVSSMRQNLATSEKNLVLSNQFRELMGGGDGTLLGAGLGAAAHGLGGAAIGALAGALTNPGKSIARLAAVERMLSKTDSRIASAVRGFFRGGRGAPELTDVAGKGFDRAVASIREASNNPDLAAQRVAKALGDLPEHAPRLSEATAEKTTKATQFLASKIPPGMQDPADLFVGEGPALVSETEKATFARYVRATTDPASVVEHLAHGSVMPEEVEALKAVHFELFEVIQQHVRHEADDEHAQGKKLSYQQRVELGTLFETPTDSTMRPDLMQAVAASMVPGGASGKKGHGGGMAAPHMRMIPDRSLNALTRTQAVSFGGGRRR